MPSQQQLVEKAARHAKSLQLEEIQNIANAWRKFDLNGDETVTIAEVDQLLDQLKIKISPEKKQSLQNDLDKNGNGIVTFQEFVMFYESGKYNSYL